MEILIALMIITAIFTVLAIVADFLSDLDLHKDNDDE